MNESQSNSPASPAIFEALQVGHQPPATGLSSAERAAFQAFQANLLSLISHELKTPVMGIKNALTLLKDECGTNSSPLAVEALRMATGNVERLERSLRTLLDLAAIESRAFRIRLRELNPARLVSAWVKDPSRAVPFQMEVAGGAEDSVLADADKLRRAIGLLEALSLRWLQPDGLKLRLSSAQITLSGKFKPQVEKAWIEFWQQAMAGFQGGIYSPTSVFSGVLQTEPAFLNRSDEEGLGSELALLHQILRSQGGELAAECPSGTLQLSLKLSLFNFQAGLPLALQNRIDQLQLDREDGGSFALVALRPGPGAEALPPELVRQQLFRSSDVLFSDVKAGQYMLLVDELLRKDVPRFEARLRQNLGLAERKWQVTSVIYPEDGTTPDQLLKKL